MPWTCPCRPHVHPVMTWTWLTPPQCLRLNPIPGTDHGKPVSVACWALSIDHILCNLVCLVPVPLYCRLIACCSLAVAHCLFSIACHLLHLVFPFTHHHLISASNRHPCTSSSFLAVDCNSAARRAFQAVHVAAACGLAWMLRTEASV